VSGSKGCGQPGEGDLFEFFEIGTLTAFLCHSGTLWNTRNSMSAVRAQSGRAWSAPHPERRSHFAFDRTL